MRDIAQMIGSGLQQTAARRDLSARGRFDEVLRVVRQIRNMPADLISGKNTKADPQRGKLKSLTAALRADDMREIHCVMQLCSTAALVKLATELVEQDDLPPHEIDYITTQVRLQINANLTLLRQTAGYERQGGRLLSITIRA